MKRSMLSLFLAFSISVCFAGEGMWIPLLLKSLNEAEMQQMGMKMSAEDIYSVNQGSLKDAIVHFGGFCTSEIISPDGLLLTNHHCGYGQIQSHSTLEKNFLKDGFWAANRSEELANPGLTATLISRIEDVSEAVLKGVTSDMGEADRQSMIDKNINALKESMKIESYEDIVVRPFFHGNQYFAFITVTYKDVRLVGTPPESIGKFGADTDNWVWPRHTGDFSMFRIYAGPDNLPAEYSEDNVPYKPKHFLPISLDGVDPGDFTLVFGFPGRTYEYLPGIAVEQTKDILDPANIAIRDKSLAIMDKYMRADEETRLKYSSKFARIANSWKKWIGRTKGLETYKALDKKAALEKEFTNRAAGAVGVEKGYSTVLSDLESAYKEILPYNQTQDAYNEIFFRNIEAFGFANRIGRLQSTLDNNGAVAFEKAVRDQKESILSRYKDYIPSIDKEVMSALLEHFNSTVPSDWQPLSVSRLFTSGASSEANIARIFDQSNVTSKERMESLLSMKTEDFKKAISTDELYQMLQDVRSTYVARISTNQRGLSDKISLLQRTYMKGLMELFPERRFYPDANSTMRITYGKVDGYSPHDAVNYYPQTYLEGVISKYVPDDYEFDVDQKLIDLYNAKDYGDYHEDGKMPVCFIGSNHTTGGNSGSPAIDAYGNLVGLNFDRTWEGTMSDFNYDPEICRNIMVDARYILFIVDKYAGASHLIDEMKLVRPKSGINRVKEEARTMEQPLDGCAPGCTKACCSNRCEPGCTKSCCAKKCDSSCSKACCATSCKSCCAKCQKFCEKMTKKMQKRAKKCDKNCSMKCMAPASSN